MEIFTFLDQRQVNLEEIFNAQPKTDNHNIESLMRKLGHNMEKQVNLWWDIHTFEQYLKENIVPRRLRWELPPNDGLNDKESIQEWFEFFNNKSLEGLKFLLKRKQKKLRLINQQIIDLKTELEPHKESTDFKKFSTQLSSDLGAKDIEVQQRKIKKYHRDLGDYRTDQVFKWQSKMEDIQTASVQSTPVREVNIQQHIQKSPPPRRYLEANRKDPNPRTPRWNNDRGNQQPYTPHAYYEQRRWQHTPRFNNRSRRPWQKPYRRPYPQWDRTDRTPRDHQEYRPQRENYDYRGRSPIPTHNRFDPIRYQEESPGRREPRYEYRPYPPPFQNRDRREHSPRRRRTNQDHSPRRNHEERHQSPGRTQREEHTRNEGVKEDAEQGRELKRKRNH